MKKIFKFIAPNGEYVECGAFDDKKQILALEVENFSDDGVMINSEEINFILPDEFSFDSKPTITSIHKKSGFMKIDAPDQSPINYKADGDPREILQD